MKFTRLSLGLCLSLFCFVTPVWAQNVAPQDALDQKRSAALDYLNSPPANNDKGLANHLSLGQSPIAVPNLEALTQSTALAITESFANSSDPQAAESQGAYASGAVGAATGLDPDFDERVNLVLKLYEIDGTDAIVRKFVKTQHMRLILTEVAKYINFSNLSESDKYRLASIVAVVQTELEDRILLLNAQIQAQILTRDDILTLISALDIPAQAKLTQVRLNDDGSVDSNADLEIKLAHYQIVRDFEAKSKR